MRRRVYAERIKNARASPMKTMNAETVSVIRAWCRLYSSRAGASIPPVLEATTTVMTGKSQIAVILLRAWSCRVFLDES